MAMGGKADTVEFLASCLWGMAQEGNLPTDAEARRRMWRRDRTAWLSEARRVTVHLDINRLALALGDLGATASAAD